MPNVMHEIAADDSPPAFMGKAEIDSAPVHRSLQDVVNVVVLNGVVPGEFKRSFVPGHDDPVVGNIMY